MRDDDTTPPDEAPELSVVLGRTNAIVARGHGNDEPTGHEYLAESVVGLDGPTVECPAEDRDVMDAWIAQRDSLDGCNRFDSQATTTSKARRCILPSLNVISPTDWDGKPVPIREWLVPNLVPAKTVTTITGDGAAGKSTLCLQLAIAGASGNPWLGQAFRPFDTIYVSAEDDSAELHRRVDAIARHYGVALADLGNLRLIDLVGQDAVLGAFDRATNRIQATALFEAINILLEDAPADVIVIDSLADAFAGNEIDRQHARQFIGLMKRLCRTHSVTVIIIAHPSLNGIASGTGSSGNTAWNNSVRSRLYFETDQSADGRDSDPSLRTLTTKKANYGPMGEQIRVRYDRGCFVALEAVGGSLDKVARESKADDVFLTLLRLHESQGIDVSANKGPTYAPARFGEHIDAQGLTKAHFRDAMQRLLSAGRIASLKFGPPSKPRHRLSVVQGGVA